MKMEMLIFLLMFLLIYFSISSYIFIRIWKVLLKNKIKGKLFIIISGLIALLPFTFMLNLTFADGILDKILYNISGVWIILFIYLFLVFLLIDIILFLTSFMKKNSGLKKHKRKLYIGAFTLFIVFSIVGVYGANKLNLTEYNVDIDLKDKYNIVFISDIHIGKAITNSHVEKLIDGINKENPDLVILGGDMLDSGLDSVNDKDGISEQFKKIKSKYGVFAVFGNHDTMGSDEEEVYEFFKKSNVSILRDEYTIINDEILLVGRYDLNFDKRKDINTYIPKTNKDYKIIVIDHQPVNYDELTKNKVSLVLSGHTHNGQMFPASLVVGSMFENSYGFKSINKLNTITSSGYGTWGARFRVFTKSEIVKISLK